jgi:phosphatidylglycerophosphate synthase
MQLILPSLVIIILAGVFVFFVIPRVSPTIIFILAIIFLFIMVQAHYYMFGDEYRLNTWRDQLKVLATPILISIMVLGLLFATSQFIFKIDIKSVIEKYVKILKPKYTNIPSSKLAELEKQL